MTLQVESIKPSVSSDIQTKIRGDLFNSLDSAIFAVDRDMNIVLKNNFAKRRFPRKTQAGANDHATASLVFGDLFEPKLKENIEGAFNRGASKNCLLRSGSKTFYFMVFPLGEYAGIIARDVTDVVGKERQLFTMLRAQSRLKDVIIIADSHNGGDPRITYVNKAFTRTYGYTRKEVIGKNPRFLKKSEVTGAGRDLIRNALADKKAVRTKICNMTKSGKDVWVEVDLFPLQGKEKNVLRWVAIERDITQRLATEEKLVHSNRKFETIAKLTRQTTWEVDLSTNVLRWGVGLETHFGYAPDPVDCAHSKWVERLHPEDLERVIAEFEQALGGKEEEATLYYRFLDAQGQFRDVADSFSITRNARGEATYLIGCISDITPLQRAISRTAQREKLEALGQLCGGVAHDFNNFLSVIIGAAEALQNDASGGAVDVAAGHILQAAEQAANITRQLLSFARSRSMERKVVNLTEFIPGLRRTMLQLVPSSIELVMPNSKDALYCTIDESQFQTALINLVVNARDAIKGNGKIQIRIAPSNHVFPDATQAAPSVNISVQDSGSGIPADVVSRIFEPFFTTKAEGKGTGLGLSMVSGFARQLGGAVSVVSELGAGTTFTIHLPRLTGNASATEIKADIADKERQERILVVDDQELIRLYVHRLLSSRGHTVEAAASGEEALELIEGGFKPSLVISDNQMPGGMSGWQLAQKLGIRYPGIRVIIGTGNAEMAEMDRPPDLENVSVMGKPYKLSDIGDAIRALQAS